MLSGSHYGLVRDLEDLARSGQGWANDAQAEDVHFIYVSAAGFKPEFEALADEDDRIRLIDLDALFTG